MRSAERKQLRADALHDLGKTAHSAASAFSEKEHAECAAADAQLVSALSRHLPRVQFGTVDCADFENNTWTFVMDGNYLVQGGRFAIMTEREYQRLIACEESWS